MERRKGDDGSMKTKTATQNFGTGIAIGLPFIVLGIVQQNIAFFIIGIALAISLGAASQTAAAKNKKSGK